MAAECTIDRCPGRATRTRQRHERGEPGFDELGITPRSIEDVAPTYLNGEGYDAISFTRAGRGYQPVEKGVIDRVSRHGEAYRGEGGFAILRDDEDDLNDQDGSSGRNKHEQGANSARHGLLRGAGADELAHQQR